LRLYWACSVWDGERLVGYVRVVSDKIIVASIHDLMEEKEYRKQGIGKKLIQLCLQKLPHGNWSAKTTTENYKFYEECVFLMPDIQNATMEYDGFIKAKLEGNR